MLHPELSKWLLGGGGPSLWLCLTPIQTVPTLFSHTEQGAVFLFEAPPLALFFGQRASSEVEEALPAGGLL